MKTENHSYGLSPSFVKQMIDFLSNSPRASTIPVNSWDDLDGRSLWVLYVFTRFGRVDGKSGVVTATDAKWFASCVFKLGLPFHPDTPFSAYKWSVTADVPEIHRGRPCFLSAEAMELDRILADCARICPDILSIGLDAANDWMKADLGYVECVACHSMNLKGNTNCLACGEKVLVEASFPTDKDILDWLTLMKSSVQWNNVIQRWTVQSQNQVCGCLAIGSTPRQAIELAMNPRKGFTEEDAEEEKIKK